MRENDLSAFAIAIVDWHLPGESGIAFARLLRQYMPEDHIFLYTADEQATRYESGSFRYMSKEVEPEVLEQTVLAALNIAPKMKLKSKFA